MLQGISQMERPLGHPLLVMGGSGKENLRYDENSD